MAAYEPKFKSGWVPPEIVGTGRSVPQEISAAVASVASASAVARSSVKEPDLSTTVQNLITSPALPSSFMASSHLGHSTPISNTTICRKTSGQVGRVKQYNKDILCFPFSDQFKGGKARPIPRGKARGKMAELGLCGKIVIFSNWSNDQIIEEVTSLFGHVFDLSEGEQLPFRYLGVVPGMKKIAYPNVSASFKWTGSAVAALSGQGGDGGIYIESGLPLIKKEKEMMEILTDSEKENMLPSELGSPDHFSDNVNSLSVCEQRPSEASKNLHDGPSNAFIPSTGNVPSSSHGSSNSDVATTLSLPFWSENDAVDIFQSNPEPSFLELNNSVSLSNQDENQSIAEILKEHCETVIKDALEFGEQTIVIRRNHAFQDCMRWFKRVDFDVEKNLKIKFVNEIGADYGGPRRECLQKILTGLTQSGIFQGEVGYLLPSHNLVKLMDKSVYQAGRMISCIICHGGPAPRIFHRILVDYICGKAAPTSADIPRLDVRNFVCKLENMQGCIELGEHKEIFDEISEEIGWFKELNERNVKEFSDRTAYHFTLVKNRACLDDFIDGLRCLDIVHLIQTYPDKMKDVLCYGPRELTADGVYSMFTFEFSDEGSNAYEKETVVALNFMHFLANCAAKACACSLEDFLQFFSGCRAEPPNGFDAQPTVRFLVEGKFPTTSTCGLVLFLPAHEDENEFVENMVFAILNSPTFDKV